MTANPKERTAMRIEPAHKTLANLRARRHQNAQIRRQALVQLLRDFVDVCNRTEVQIVDMSDRQNVVLQLVDLDCALKLNHLTHLTLEHNGQTKVFPLQDLLDYDVQTQRFEGKDYSDVVPLPGERPERNLAVDVFTSWLASEIHPA
jgi:hypothetical protein